MFRVKSNILVVIKLLKAGKGRWGQQEVRQAAIDRGDNTIISISQV